MSPRVEHLGVEVSRFVLFSFQFTLSVWGALLTFLGHVWLILLFRFMLSVWGAQQQAAQVVEGFGFNSHSPSGEHSSKNNQRLNARCFNSRSPYGEHSSLFCPFHRISGFNSRSPYGEHHDKKQEKFKKNRFNSRSPYGEHCLFLKKHILKFRFA